MAKPFPFKVCEACAGGGEGGSGGVSITVDKVMSDTSENPVQNKVVKKYVDDTVKNYVTTATFNETVNMFGMDVNELRGRMTDAESAIAEHQTWILAHGERLTNIEGSIGDMETALDSIIAMQNNLIGGDAS